MNAFHRLHGLRMENDAKRYEMDDMRPRFDAIANRGEDGTAPRAVSAYQLFQTPPDLARRLVDGLPEGTMSILEPSAGLGRIYSEARKRFASARICLVELAPQCAGELYAISETDEAATLIQKDFLKVPALPEFDAVAMNPPYRMRSDVKHVLHALAFLAPGGVLRALVMDTAHREMALKSLCSAWEPIPAGAFNSEGTSVPVVLITIERDSIFGLEGGTFGKA